MNVVHERYMTEEERFGLHFFFFFFSYDIGGYERLYWVILSFSEAFLCSHSFKLELSFLFHDPVYFLISVIFFLSFLIPLLYLILMDLVGSRRGKRGDLGTIC